MIYIIPYIHIFYIKCHIVRKEVNHYLAVLPVSETDPQGGPSIPQPRVWTIHFKNIREGWCTILKYLPNVLAHQQLAKSPFQQIS